ncbi:hypothetical protein MRS76_14030 [Rhizobiaceae bacterium n13]|uniref:Uncharacterized protein n=1 Tax=Ferirhizobium litorale TaxID=2927786 RepID=A0AAE3U317_9HYPH|nr:hypothetical protein [Fererhizobium litorale]MDI7863076.1 hypothetical protein [Fererhizobium litorale]MDI7923247.1 hypothetical protein [Fererhizobium litorale]
MTPAQKLGIAAAEKGTSMLRCDNIFAEGNIPALSVGHGFRIPVSSKTKAKTTTKIV